MIAGKWFITPHAVRRYIQRVDQYASYDEALSALIRLSEIAKPNKWINPTIFQFRGPKPLRLRLRVVFDKIGLPRLITVMKGKGV